MRKTIVRKACLLALAACTVTACAWAAPQGKQTENKNTDPAFTVPVVENPISDEAIKGNKIMQDGRRWLVSDKTLEQYGVYPNAAKDGQYWFELPEAAGSQFGSDRHVSLTLPGRKSKDGRNISIAQIRRPLGISYVLDTDGASLLPASQPRRTALQLKQQPQPEGEVLKKYSKDNLGMVLFWDPVMLETEDIQPLKTKQPVVSPCAFRISRNGIILRNPDFDTLLMDWKAKGYAVWPLVDNDFSPKLTHEVLSNQTLRQQLIKELIGYSILYDFTGYNIDFENVNYSDKNLLTQFVTEFSTAAHAYGIKTSMDVTPLSDSPNWSLVYDRAALSREVDYLMLMAYDQVGRTSPVAGPTATRPWVEKAIQNTLSFAPADKVILGVPLYMRIWYESEDGKDLPKDFKTWPQALKTAPQAGKKKKLFVRTLTLADSQILREKYASQISWNADLGLYYLDAQLPKGRLQVWFEDEKSLKEKIALARQYQLAGVSFWRKGFEPANFWHGFAKHELT